MSYLFDSIWSPIKERCKMTQLDAEGGITLSINQVRSRTRMQSRVPLDYYVNIWCHRLNFCWHILALAEELDACMYLALFKNTSRNKSFKNPNSNTRKTFVWHFGETQLLIRSRLHIVSVKYTKVRKWENLIVAGPPGCRCLSKVACYRGSRVISRVF